MDSRDIIQGMRFTYYLTNTYIDLREYSQTKNEIFLSNSIYIIDQETLVTSYGKIYSNRDLGSILPIINKIQELSHENSKVIAMSEVTPENNTLIFCPNLNVACEIVFKELCDIIGELNKGIISDFSVLRDISNDVVATFFYSKDIKEGFQNKNQFHGLILLDTPLRNYLVDNLLKINPVIPSNYFRSDKQISNWKIRLEAVGLGVIGSLIATGIVELVTRFIVFNPFGSPNINQADVDELEFNSLFETDGRIDKWKKVTAKEVALDLKVLEHFAIAIINGYNETFKKTSVNKTDRSYRICKEKYLYAAGFFQSGGNERLISGDKYSYLLKEFIEVYSYTYEQKGEFIERSQKLGDIVDWYKESTIQILDDDIDELVSRYLDLYARELLI